MVVTRSAGKNSMLTGSQQAHVGIGGSVIHSKVNVNVGKDIAVTHQLVKSVDPSGQGTGGGSLQCIQCVQE